MLSGRLVHQIETNFGSIIRHVISQVRRDPELAHIRQLPDAELGEWGQHILERLGDWLAVGTEHELASHYEAVGRARFEEGIPLHEVVHALFLIKDKTIAFVLDQAAARTFMQLYAEEELEHRVDRFFDILVCHIVRGYENALRMSARAGAYA
jgi:hypothetical protein